MIDGARERYLPRLDFGPVFSRVFFALPFLLLLEKREAAKAEKVTRFLS